MNEKNISIVCDVLRTIVIETIKNAQFGIGTIVHRHEYSQKYNGVYYYTIRIGNDTSVISSKDLFAVGETVIVCRVENTSLLIDVSKKK